MKRVPDSRPSMPDFRFPKTSERVSIVGRTGSGKTQLGTWLLSHAPVDRMPYVVLDYKGDDLINSIQRARHISINELPKPTEKHAGIYIVPLHPSDEEGVERLLMKIWEQENTGLFIDEAFMIPKHSPAFMGVLTQGRSKNIPAIVLSQRPVLLSKFVFTEADHFSVFHLNHSGDRKKVNEYLDGDMEQWVNPMEFHSHWYDVKRNKSFLLQPVPNRDTILNRFNDRLKPKRSFF